MPDSVVEVSQNKAKKSKFNKKDFDYLGQYISDEYDRRKNLKMRVELERKWKDIDRQLEIEPDLKFKKLPNGTVDTKRRWMSEMELPLQAQSLEVLTADARRMMFPDEGPWFVAKSLVTDEYLRNVDLSSRIPGDENDVPSIIAQDNVDKMVAGFCLDIFRQTGVENRIDSINAESFKYGLGVGRLIPAFENTYRNDAKGVYKKTRKLPLLIPCSLKNFYPDDRGHSYHTAQVFGDSDIINDRMRYENVIIAASRGSNDPYDFDGGWMAKQVTSIEPCDDGFIDLIEMEGDLVIPKKGSSGSVILYGAIATAARGKDGKCTVIRLRFRSSSESSYLKFPYHNEHIGNPYPTSPLLKGRCIQIPASDALGRTIDSAAIKIAPPISYDENDPSFAGTGGPEIAPYALWPTSTSNIQVHSDIGGDPSVMMHNFQILVNLYAELTGILPSRLGAQTVSHTTAYAKDAEMQRGAIRTVDYVKSVGSGAMTQLLQRTYTMARNELKKNEDINVFISAYDSFVRIDKEALPEEVFFQWQGASGPSDEMQIQAIQQQALMTAVQLDQLGAAQGKPPEINTSAAIREVLRKGKWTDVDAITNSQGAASGNQTTPGLPGASGANPGNISTALQALAFSRGG